MTTEPNAPPPSPPVPPRPPQPPQQSLAEFNEKYGVYIKLGFLLFLVLLLVVPLQLIQGLVGERKARRDVAVREIARTWGNPQRIAGPALVIPYKYTIPPRRFVDEKGQTRLTEPEVRTGVLHVLPEALSIDGSLEPTVRYRGIFEAILYTTKTSFKGTFALPDVAKLGIKPEDVQWDQAWFAVGISDLRGARGEARLTWDGSRSTFLPRTKSASLGAGMHAPVTLTAPPAGQTPRAIAFSFDVAFTGSRRIVFAPVGKATKVTLTSPWLHPSFDGAYLPTKRTIDAKGFRATWEVSYLGRDYPQVWLSHGPDASPNANRARTYKIVGSQFGVSLVSPVDFYLKTERSVKYGILFVLLVLSAIFAFEVTKDKRIHTIQYALVGAALCVFFLMLLSIAELTGFLVAYVVAALLATAMVALYVAKIMASWVQAATIAALLAGIYAFIYVVLQLEDYALIVGSIGVFVALAAVMYGTRNVNWYRPKGKAEAEAEA